MTMLKPYRVAVFPMPWTDAPQFVAYVRVYSREWPDCCLHDVEAKDREKAKVLAMREHTLRCLKDPKRKAESDVLRRNVPFREKQQ